MLYRKVPSQLYRELHIILGDDEMIPQESDWKAIGIHEYRVISTDDIPFEPEIRKICEDNVCRLYGKTWACPQAVGTVEQ